MLGILEGFDVKALGHNSAALLHLMVEAKKVVWPTRKEAMQTTGIVFVFVFVMAMFLWLVDAGLLWVTQRLLGQGG